MAKTKLLPELVPTNLVSGQFSNIFNQTEKFWHELPPTRTGETDLPAFFEILLGLVHFQGNRVKPTGTIFTTVEDQPLP